MGRILASICAIAISTQTGVAAPLSVSEGGLGDFGDTNATSTGVGVLDIGVNVVDGGLNADLGDLFDYFHATLLAGHTITQVEVSTLAPPLSAAISTSANLTHMNNLTTFPQSEFLSAAGLATLTPGTVSFRASIDGIPPLTFPPEGTYRFEITVVGAAVIPEPATLGLFGLGLAGVTVLRRRRS